jgi:hypothetical protein
MSAICQRIESALVRYLLQVAGNGDLLANSFALATNASQVQVTPIGLLVQMEDNASFTLNFYSGESEERVQLPAIIVVCDTAQRMEDVPNVQTCNVEVSLEVQCDSTEGVNSVAWLDQASRWLHSELSGSVALARDLEVCEPGMVVSFVSHAECGRAVDGRRRIHRWSFQIVASI